MNEILLKNENESRIAGLGGKNPEEKYNFTVETLCKLIL